MKKKDYNNKQTTTKTISSFIYLLQGDPKKQGYIQIIENVNSTINGLSSKCMTTTLLKLIWL